MKRLLVAVLFCIVTAAWAADSANPFVGRWALTIPGGGAGWLGIEEKGGALEGGILWGGGSVVPVSSVKVEGDTLIVTRVYENRRQQDGKEVVTRETEIIKGKVEGDTLNLTTQRERNGKTSEPAKFSGKRIPALPPAPDLSKVKFGEPIKLFNGENLDGWTLIGGSANGCSAQDGVLTNNPVQTPGQPHKNYGNIRTEKEFEDFNLKLEVNVAKGGNSGIYLRGIYEIQVADTFGKKLDPHNMGGIYSRVTPAMAAEKPAGEWQTYDITLVDRHVTVVLNGQKIHDNVPLMGVTGGALWSDEFRPGPIYLQGDHTAASYRNIVLTPVVK